MRFPRNLTGEEFGQLTVQRFVGGKYRKWECLCSCGKTKEVARTLITSGNTKSCGCLRRKMVSERFTKHGHSKTPKQKSLTYISWRNMIQRVTSDRPKDFKWYKAKGITVCDRWQGPDGFVNFLADLGERPTKGHSIDRINSDGNYELSNCKWSTAYEQVHNRGVSRK